jgi:hypothetical protein
MEAGFRTVESKEFRGPLFAHVARERTGVGTAEINHDEPVERVAEPVIGAESQQPPAELEIVS